MIYLMTLLMIKKDKEPKIFKTNLLAIIKTSQLNIKKQIIKKKKNKKKKRKKKKELKRKKKRK